jgi:hypothetical protein
MLAVEVLLLGQRSGWELAEVEALRWLWDSFAPLGSIVVLMWVDGDLWGLLGIGAMLRLLRGLLWIRRLPLYWKAMSNVRGCIR